MKHLFIALALIVMMPFQAKADLWCRGKFTQVYTDNSGYVVVYASFRNGYLTLCNVNSTWKGISTATCAAMLTTALAAQKTGFEAQMYYIVSKPAPANMTSCATIPAYNQAPASYYVMISR